MSKRRSLAAFAAAVFVMSSLAGCGGGSTGTPATTTAANNAGGDTTTAAAAADTQAPANNDAGGDATEAPAAEPAASGDIKEFTAFYAVPGNELNDGNDVEEIIAQKIGARCKQTWLTGQTADEAIGVMIAGGEYPDFIDASTGSQQLIDAGGCIPIDEYWDGYDNLKNFWTEEQWNSVRAEDGHIYIIPQFGNRWMYDTETTHNDEAFWIQVRVLEWAGYPKITTLDQYFQVIEDYIAANPTMADGKTPNIGYEILSDDWRYFCLENAPFFLDGYPNDGCIIVDRDTHQAIDYNTTPTAKRYFQKLNEEYKKGIVDPETFTMKYDQYISKLSTGAVCGMVDQHWDFNDGELAIKKLGLDECTYVPLGIVIDEGVVEHYHSPAALDVSNGVSITTSCKDIPGALKFMDDLLSPEILTLRNWGVEGEDYLVGDDGLYYRTDEMRANANDQAYINKHLCSYSYFPNYSGMDHDGINAASPQYQPKEFYDSLKEPVKKCFDAYGVETYVQFLNKAEGTNEPWYPMWSWSNNLTSDTDEGFVWANMAEVKHEYLPKVVMSDDFEAGWDEYMKQYSSRCDIDVFLNAANAEIQRRIDVANGN
ncbi:MAG: sugar ABC transporter substrate-binding protein [Oscillospiraceae bacterium]|nr:sugar ABC transporter substrate-binding protein [Oscillospiraceae bacterium]